MATAELLSRRDFARGSAALLGAAVAGCAAPDAARRQPSPPDTYQAASETRFPLLEVRGAPYAMGRTIGQRFAAQIRGGFEARAAWWRRLKAIADAQPAKVYDTFLAAARRHAPHIVEELRGWADGCGLPFRDLMLLNLKAEYQALHDRRSPEPQPGCSTIVKAGARGFVLAHNEDGDQAYRERMFVVRMRPEGKPAVLCASYPGILPGNAPWINDAGLIMTTNFIYTREVRLGVGRYFLDRLAMEARSLDEAVAICTHPERAYAFHHVLASASERRVLSIEVTPTRQSRLAIDGLFLHTNHLVHPALAGEQQDLDYVGTSSLSRWQVLGAWKAGVAGREARLTPRDLVRALASHEQSPYSPCRHPQGKVRGTTLLTALFETPVRAMQIYKGQPCRGRREALPLL